MSVAELEPSVEFVTRNENHVYVSDNVSSDNDLHNPVDVDAMLSRMDIGDLTQSQRQHLEKVIAEYKPTFSQDEDDIGFCDLVEHTIITTDDHPTKIPHRRVPPQQWTEENTSKSL